MVLVTKMYKVKVKRPRRYIDQNVSDISTGSLSFCISEPPEIHSLIPEYSRQVVEVGSDVFEQVELSRANHKKRLRRRRRVLTIGTLLSVCLLLTLAVMITILMRNYEPPPAAIKVDIPSGEYSIETAIYCPVCDEKQDDEECTVCKTTEISLDV